jgi:hypothetical protein
MIRRQAWLPADPSIHIKKTSFMQRIADRVRSGATHYIGGRTPLSRVPALVQKLAGRWPLNLSAMQASRRTKAGHATYYWIGWHDEENKVVHWFVLQKPGTTPDTEDTWKNALDDRIGLTGYELVRHTRTGAKNPAWTWRYNKARFEDIRAGLIADIRGRRDLLAQQAVHSMFRSPGFAGVREQVKRLRALCISEWKRSRKENEPMFEIPPTIGYVRRLRDTEQRWSQLTKPI